MIKGTIFNIQRFSIADGEGIRTLVFMKGCPLSCLWCSNPESQSFAVEIMDVKANCKGCGKCVSLCEKNAISPMTFNIDKAKCRLCGDCAHSCYANAKKLVGKEYSVSEVTKIISEDAVFYRNSGGGVTIGGGEPVSQPEFVSQLLRSCKMMNIHTAIETSGFGIWEEVEPVFRYTDQILYDLKVMDNEHHRRLTGVSNEIILENARRIASLGRQTVFRIPVISGLNGTIENISATGDFVRELCRSAGDGGNIDHANIAMELLPYHDFGKDKYKWLQKESYVEAKRPEAQVLEEYKQLLRDKGIKVV